MTETTKKPALDGWKKIAVDFGPLLIFFLAYNRYDMFVATGAFMAATAVAIIFSFALTRHVPAMTWFSALLVGVFGGLTLWLHDETFIKMKPTIVFAIFAAILFFGLATGRNYLQRLLGSAFTGLTERGWSILALRWAIFFVLLAVLNEIFWRFFPTNIWLHFKLWGDTLLTFAFAMAQIPMMTKHGLKLDDKKQPDDTGKTS